MRFMAIILGKTLLRLLSRAYGAFLWMMHPMDYQSRDNFNTTLLRGFSLLGLVTVLSGFTLWGVSTSLFRQRKAK